MLTFQYSIDSKLPPAFVPAGSDVSNAPAFASLDRVRRDPARG